MSRRSIATPCPTSTAGTNLFMKSLDETTTTLNFTTAFDASFRDVKPRRKQRLSVQFDIHEDENADHDNGKPQTTRLARPARRMTGSFSQHRTAMTSKDEIEHTVRPRLKNVSRLGQAPRRPPNRLSIVPESAVKEPEPIQEEDTKSMGFTIHAARPVRRGTIYIPSDDTTMPSMYMGVFSPLKDLEASARNMSEPTLEMTGIAAQMAVKRGQGRRVSMIDAAPRRAPLQTSTRCTQETAFPLDRPGQNGGKENIPPGLSECEKQMLDLNLVGPPSATPLRPSPPRAQNQFDRRKSARTSIYMLPTNRTEKWRPRVSMPATSDNFPVARGSKREWNAGSQMRQSTSISTRALNVARVVSKSAPEPIKPKPRVPTRFVIPVIPQNPATKAHSILADNITDAKLYEDDWLGHQEIAITQLLNKLFTAARPGKHESCTSRTLTQELLEIYHAGEVAVLHNRIQAALLYGALSIPQDILDQGEAFTKDMGRKQRFIDLWIETYDRDALEAGLEVVIGRQCRAQVARASVGNGPARSPTRKALHNFIDSFLLRNEDSRLDRTVRDRAAWSYQRTILRSLMLIKILDLVKTSGTINFSTALFQSKSPFKSSVGVLQALFQMMNPAAGDPIRALSHIDYSVRHTQYPLEEFQYNIENLAVDLRDGVRLTRLIELLLYPSASRTLDKNADVEATTTIIMPAGDSFEFLSGQDWPLSQHLKFPCLSRVARLWNVQIALSAAARVKGMETMVDGITAEDVVDGFREKTIRLLWALVGKCGLASLIDWNDVKWETRRLQLRSIATAQDSPDSDEILDHTDNDNSTQHTFESCKNLLKNWVRAVAASQGIQVRNFTTSFADGKIFEAIVDTYEPYLSPSATSPCKPETHRHASPHKHALTDRLANLGCSKQFADLFASETTHIFDRDFVLATLAFLCSRLLTPSKSARAASVIQAQWRIYRARREDQRNVHRKMVAVACADFVNTCGLSRLRRTVIDCASRDGETCEEARDGMGKVDVSIPLSPGSESAGDIWLSL